VEAALLGRVSDMLITSYKSSIFNGFEKANNNSATPPAAAIKRYNRTHKTAIAIRQSKYLNATLWLHKGHLVIPLSVPSCKLATQPRLPKSS
jgi:hypothetical protein